MSSVPHHNERRRARSSSAHVATVRLALSLLVSTSTGSALAQAVYRCNVDGRAVYQSQACADGVGRELKLAAPPSEEDVAQARARAAADEKFVKDATEMRRRRAAWEADQQRFKRPTPSRATCQKAWDREYGRQAWVQNTNREAPFAGKLRDQIHGPAAASRPSIPVGCEEQLPPSKL